jgi:hypothetical protein
MGMVASGLVTECVAKRAEGGTSPGHNDGTTLSSDNTTPNNGPCHVTGWHLQGRRKKLRLARPCRD